MTFLKRGAIATIFRALLNIVKSSIELLVDKMSGFVPLSFQLQFDENKFFKISWSRQ